MLQFIRPVTIRIEPAKPIVKKDHDEKNMQLNRPLSPHLSIYAYELQSFMSITHRATGMVMTMGVAGFSVGALVLPNNLTYYLDAIAAMNLNPALIFGAKFLISLPLVYHTVNGMRHLTWDMGKLLHIKEVMKTEYVVLGLSLIGTIALSMM